jgi:hypothetical protein
MPGLNPQLWIWSAAKLRFVKSSRRTDSNIAGGNKLWLVSAKVLSRFAPTKSDQKRVYEPATRRRGEVLRSRSSTC